MNQEAILAVLTDSKDDAKSLKEDGPGNQNLCRLDPRREATVQLFEGSGKMGPGGSGAQANGNGSGGAR